MYANVDALDLATGHRTWHGSLPPVGIGSAINNVAVAGTVVYATSGSNVWAFAAAGCRSTSPRAPIWAPRLGVGTYIFAQWNGQVVTGGRLLCVDQIGLHAYAASMIVGGYLGTVRWTWSRQVRYAGSCSTRLKTSVVPSSLSTAPISSHRNDSAAQ